MSIFIVDLASAGVTRGPKEHKMGQRASQVGGLIFENVRLPGNALLGEFNRGFHIIMSVLDKGRIGIAALAVALPRRRWRPRSPMPRRAANSANP